MLAHISALDVRFRFAVMYSDWDGTPQIKTVEAATPVEARMSISGRDPVVLFEEPPTEFSEGDHVRT